MPQPVPRVASSTDDASRGLDALEEQFEHFAVAVRQQVRTQAADIHPALPPAGYRTLKTLAQLGPTGPSALADAIGCDRSVLSRQLHQLLEVGLVVRATDPHDRRAAIVEVTPAARARLAAVRDRTMDSFRRRLDAWDPADLEHLTRLLSRLWADLVE